MMYSEFTKLTGVEVSASEYASIEAQYMACDDNKVDFCKKWKRKYNASIAAERKRQQEEHGIHCLFAYMDGVSSIGLPLCRSDSLYDKKVISTIQDCGQRLYWCVRKTGTELFIDKDDYDKWCIVRGNRDDFAQYEIVCMGDGIFNINRIK